MRKKDEIANKLKELWNQENSDSYVITNNIIHSFSDIFNIQEACIKKKIKIKSVETIKSDIPYYCSFGKVNNNILKSIEFSEKFPVTKTNIEAPKIIETFDPETGWYEPQSSHENESVETKTKYARWTITNRTGIFKVTLTNDKHFYFANWEVSYGKMLTDESICLSTADIAITLLKLKNDTIKYQEKPKPGIFDISNSQYGIQYSALNLNANRNQIIHPHTDTILNDITEHFNRLEQRKYHDRSVLLYSMAGTGKTEFIKNIAWQYKDTHCVVFCRSIDAMFSHQQLAAKYNIPTIVILEEFEESVSAYNQSGDFRRVNSSVKNILSGVYEFINKKGCYKIYTTNYPERIDPTILHRKQRIDRMINFGPLMDDYALDCAKLYMGDEIFNALQESEQNNELLEIFNKLPGVEIKSLCEEFITYCEASEASKTLDILFTLKQQQYQELKNVYDFANDQDVFIQKLINKERKPLSGFSVQK